MGAFQGRQLTPHLEVAGLSVRYGDWLALDRLDLGIAQGELFVLLGGSGSGKTTLLRALAGFIPPAAGRVTLGGRDITALPPYRRPVNTMFQSYALFPHMSVASNIGFGLRRQGVPRAEIDRRVAELLALVRLEDFAARRPDALSGGQRQRVALARSLAPRPDLLLLDEPLSALDRGLREATRTELVRVQRQLGTTFVLVTHDQEEALSMATRIGLLEKGRLAQVGTPMEIYERPVSRSVAAFMGAANILPARGARTRRDRVAEPGRRRAGGHGGAARRPIRSAASGTVAAVDRARGRAGDRVGGGERVSRHDRGPPGAAGGCGSAAGVAAAGRRGGEGAVAGGRGVGVVEPGCLHPAVRVAAWGA